eukprot:3595191-Prymnesium_polylepis.1
MRPVLRAVLLSSASSAERGSTESKTTTSTPAAAAASEAIRPAPPAPTTKTGWPLGCASMAQGASASANIKRGQTIEQIGYE